MSNPNARAEHTYQYTREAAIKAAEADAHLDPPQPNPDDRSARPGFAIEIVDVAARLQKDIFEEYSKAISPLDAETVRLIRLTTSPSAVATRNWEQKFATSIHSEFWYWVGLILVFGADIAVNAYVFQSWGDNDWAARFIAFAVGIGLLIMAKFTAWSTRSGPSIIQRVMGLVLLVLPLAALWLISATRYQAMSAEGRTIGNSFALYYTLNVMFFAVGFLMSFFKETGMERMEKRLDDLTQKRQAVFEQHAIKADSVIDDGLWFIDTYRTFNDRAQGVCGQWTTPAFPFPRGLKKLQEPGADAMDTTAMDYTTHGATPAAGQAAASGSAAPTSAETSVDVTERP